MALPPEFLGPCSIGLDHKIGAYVSHYGSEETGASLFLLARCGYVEPGDVKMRGAFVRRYRVDEGLPGRDQFFRPCEFWAVEYLALAGQFDAAERRLKTRR